MIIDHTHPKYWEWLRSQNIKNPHNGAYYYSIEIVNNIIPNIRTSRNWITLNVPEVGVNHSIVFIHNNINTDLYTWLSVYDDLILVCGIPETCEKVKHLGIPIYLPLSVDISYVSQFKKSIEEKYGDTAYAGRYSKQFLEGCAIPENVDLICNLNRQELLDTLSLYKNVYAVGRTAIEAKILNCNVLPYDPRFPDPSIWEPWDNLDAAKYLQIELDKIDRIRL